VAPRIPPFIWTEENIEHIARHQVEPHEVEEVRSNVSSFRKGRYGRYYLIGQTDAGRWLFVVIEKNGYVATAREADDRERKL